MKIWNNGEWVEIEIGQRVFIGRSCRFKVHGEFGRFESTTAHHAVFVSDSGSVIKTAIDNLCLVSGGFKRQYWVSLDIDRVEGRDYMWERPNYWNDRKCELCYK